MHDNLQIRFLFLPDGEDPDSLVRKEGKPAFEKRLESALSLSAFFFQTLSRQSDMNTMEGRARFAASSLSFIKQLPADIFQGILIEELSKRARVDIESLKQQIKSAEAPKATDTGNHYSRSTFEGQTTGTYAQGYSTIDSKPTSG